MVTHIYVRDPAGDYLMRTMCSNVTDNNAYGFSVGDEVFNHQSFYYTQESTESYQDRLKLEAFDAATNSPEAVAKAEREIEMMNLLIDLGVIV